MAPSGTNRPRRAPKALAAVAVATAAFALPFEGMKLTPYYDPPGILTVCAGHTKTVVKGKRYTLEECKVLLKQDMHEAVAAVDRCVPGLPEPVLMAFSDAVYNLGPVIACDTKNSTAARLLKVGNYPAACAQLPRWDKARVLGVMTTLPGLTKRRLAERAVCESAFTSTEKPT